MRFPAVSRPAAWLLCHKPIGVNSPIIWIVFTSQIEIRSQRPGHGLSCWVMPNCAEAIRGIEQFSHIWLLFLFDQNLMLAGETNRASTAFRG